MAIALMSYHVGTVAIGLLIHPYKTMQQIVHRGIPGSAVLLPLFLGMFLILALRFLAHFLFALLPFLGLWWFLVVWSLFFLFFWQILLLYLFVRFSTTFHS